MKTPIKDHLQQKVTGGKQKVILDPAETAETDEMEPNFYNTGAEQYPIPKPADDNNEKIK